MPLPAAPVRCSPAVERERRSWSWTTAARSSIGRNSSGASACRDPASVSASASCSFERRCGLCTGSPFAVPIGSSCRAMRRSSASRQTASRGRGSPAITSRSTSIDSRPRIRGSLRPAIRRTLGAGDGDVLALSLGRLTPEKGLDLLVDSAARLPAGRRPILAIGGSGPMRMAIERQATERGLDVHMLGEIDPEALPSTSSAPRTCLPTRHCRERTCRSPSSRPWRARASSSLTDQPPSAHELLADGRGIVFVPAGNVDAYTEALALAVSMGGHGRCAAGEAARRWVEVEHAPERVGLELAGAFSRSDDCHRG